jgi:PIN domain nuclease of toxin-antitoxin system
MSSSATRTELTYVVDTHALIWYLQGSSHLSPIAHSIFQAAERGETILCVSAISVAEMYYANKKYHWFEHFSEMYTRLKEKPHFLFVSFAADDIIDFDHDGRVPEMHDRIIAGLARRLRAPLLTSDSAIRANHVGVTLW